MGNKWQTKKLGEVCEVIAGQSPEGKYYNNFGDGLPFHQGKKEFTEKYLGSPTTWTKNVTKEAQKGDILISVRAPVGPVNFASGKICIGRGLAAIRTSKYLDRDFLFNFLIKHESEIIGNSGAVFNSINKKQIEDIAIPVPPIPEQKRIVIILSEAFDALAKAKENAEMNLQNAQELFDSYLQGIFANSGDDWEVKRIDQISENLDSNRIPVTKRDRHKGRYPYYGASGIVDYVGSYIFDEELLLVSEDGANLLARTYPIAFSVSGKIWVNNHAHVLRFKDKATQRFLEYYLNSIQLNDYVGGMAQPKLNQTMLNSITISLPLLQERTSIVATLDKLSEEIKKLEGIYQNKLADLEELRKSVLHKAFNGELTGA